MESVVQSGDKEIDSLWKRVSEGQGRDKAEALLQLSYKASQEGDFDESLASRRDSCSERPIAVTVCPLCEITVRQPFL